MGEFENYNDFVEMKEYNKALLSAKVIMNRKASKTLIGLWIDNCIYCLECLKKDNKLPSNFDNFSIYKQREIINNLELIR